MSTRLWLRTALWIIGLSLAVAFLAFAALRLTADLRAEVGILVHRNATTGLVEEIENLDGGINVRVRYRVDSLTYAETINYQFGGSSLRVGDSLKVYYDERDPRRIGAGWFNGLASVLVDLMFLGVAGWLCVALKRVVTTERRLSAGSGDMPQV